MATYTADAVAMNRLLVETAPDRVTEIFERAEAGLDTVLAAPIQIAEVTDTFWRGEQIAGVEPSLKPREAVRRLTDGPITILNNGPRELLGLDRLFDLYSMHDAMLVAAHRTRQTDGILTNDDVICTYDRDAVVWS
jgi:hypothetical protein